MTTPTDPDLAALIASIGGQGALSSALADSSPAGAAAPATGKTRTVLMPKKLGAGESAFPTSDYLSPSTGGRSVHDRAPAQVNESVNAERAKLDFLNWSDAEMSDLAHKLIAAGMLDETYTRSDLEQVWSSMVDKAADHAAAGKDVTPFDMIGLYAGTDIRTGRSTTPTASTVVQRQVSLTDPDQARALLDSALSNQLGRRATPVELDDFQAALNSAQRAQPSITTTTSTPDAQGNTSVDSTTQQGVDVNSFADKYGRTGSHSAEYGHYQAATTYANALFKAIAAPV